MAPARRRDTAPSPAWLGGAEAFFRDGGRRGLVGPGFSGIPEILLAALFCLVAGLARPCAAAAAGDGAGSAPTRSVCIRGTCFAAEIALTEEERGRGLMYRTALARDSGMLFVFPQEGIHRFWMKNTKIELDILFIAADNKIVSITKRARPCTKDPCAVYAPSASVAYALEINGGLADAYGFAPDDAVEFR